MNENQMMPLQADESFPFIGRLVDAERTETGIFVQIPADMLNNTGILKGMSRVEVWRVGWDSKISNCYAV